MTDHTELIARLRYYHKPNDTTIDDACNAIEAQAAEIERLTANVDNLNRKNTVTQGIAGEAQAERDTLRAQLAAAQGQDTEIDLTPRTPKQQAEALAWVERQRMQREPFTPDWSQDSAAAGSIREHQAICNLLLKEMRHIAGISTGQVKRVAEQALEAVKQ